MKMKKNYKLQNTKIINVLGAYFKLSIVNCQLSIVNETSIPGLLVIPNYNFRNYKQKAKGSHGLHQDSIRLQTMTALIKSFCRGVQGGQFFQKAPPLAAGGKKRSEP